MAKAKTVVRSIGGDANLVDTRQHISNMLLVGVK
jgi:hypothetical protein